MVLKIDAKFEGKLTCAFQNNMGNLENFYWLKNSDFILESKMAKSKQKFEKKAVKIGGFLQCLVHIFLGHDGCF